MQTESIEPAHQQYGGHILRAYRFVVERSNGRDIGKHIGKLLHGLAHLIVMPPYEVTESYDARCDKKGNPASLFKLLIQRDRKDGHADHETHQVDDNMFLPILVTVLVFDKESHHSKLGKGKGHEHVD